MGCIQEVLTGNPTLFWLKGLGFYYSRQVVSEVMGDARFGFG